MNYCVSHDLGETVDHAKNCPNYGRPDIGNRNCISKPRKAKK